jgi:hypothetical protein
MAITTQAIETKYLRATNVRGARIKATAWGGSVTITAIPMRWTHRTPTGPPLTL